MSKHPILILIVLFCTRPILAQDWRVSVLLAEDGLPADEVRSVMVDSHGAVWAGTREGVGRLVHDEWEAFTAEDGMLSNGATDIIEDAAGRIWVSGPAGVSVYASEAWATITDLDWLQPRIIFDLAAKTDSTVWFGANGGGGYYDHDEWTVYSQANGLSHQVVHSAWEDRSGVKWFACRRGLVKMKEDSVEVLFPDVNFGSILEAANGQIWFGSRTRGAAAMRGATFEWHSVAEDLRPVAEDAEGKIWAVSEEDSGEGSVWFFGDGRWSRLNADGVFDERTVFDIAIGRDGSVWVGTSRGLIHLKPH